MSNAATSILLANETSHFADSEQRISCHRAVSGKRHSRLSRSASGSHFPDFRERSLLPEGVSFMSFHRGLNSTRGLRVLRAICLVGCALVTLCPAYGQSTAEWITSSVDPARDAWQRGGSKISTKTVRKLQLLWKTKVESKTMGMQSFR